MIRAIRRHPVLAAGFLLAAVLTVMLALRLGMLILGWSDPGVAARPVEGWMTPRYLVRVYDLPPEALAGVLGIEQGSAPTRSVNRIAAETGRSPAALVAQIEALRGAAPADRP